jgi:2-octaprenyl-6-methoxyphenol hydroxylase
MSESFDVVIAGGGMVGASLAVALKPLGLKLALIESVPLRSEAQPSFDERTTALSNGSRRIFTSLGVWDAIAAEAAPIRRIHVSDQGRFGFARIDAREQGVAALGFVVANRVLGAALWARFSGGAGLETFCPAHVDDIAANDDGVELRVTRGDGTVIGLRARLVVAADGAQSSIRAALGIDATTWDYDETAIVTNVATRKFHDHVAYERFTPSGPLAILPLADGRCTVVWTLAPDVARSTLELSDADFLHALQERFGFRLGRFTRVGRRHAYPLALTRAEERVGTRVVIIGNAAQGLHPVAGQGFNLGLRDAATLAEVIADSRASLGDAAMLARYDEWRRTDRRSVIAFTDGLIRLFNNPLGTVKVARDLGLLLFDLLPPAKSALSALSLGVTGRLPRLARGVPLA